MAEKMRHGQGVSKATPAEVVLVKALVQDQTTEKNQEKDRGKTEGP